jgi:hypothetical protein
VNESGGREHDGRDATEPDDAHANVPHPTGWTAPIIDAPLASGAADTDPGSAPATWEGDDWAWNANDDVDETTPDIDHELARIEEAPTSPGVPAVSAGTTALAYENDAPSYRRERRSRDDRRRIAVGITALACFAILIGALIATMGGGDSAEPKRADTPHAAKKKATASTTTSTSIGPTTVPVPTTVVLSATVAPRPPTAPPAPAPNPPPTCNIVTQILGCH